MSLDSCLGCVNVAADLTQPTFIIKLLFLER
jgi:hypothetical protein